MPLAERQLGQHDHEREQAHAGQRDQQEGCEHARDVELEAGLQDLVGEAGAAAAGAGDELGDHRPDQREAARDAQAAEEIGQRAWDAQPPQRLQSAGLVHAEQAHQPRVDAAQPQCGVGNHRKEGDDGGADRERHLGVFHQDDDQRRDRDNGSHLQQHRIGEKAHLDGAALHEQERDQRAQQDGDDEGLQCDAQRDAERAQKRRPVACELRRDVARLREQEDGDMGGAAADLPDHHQDDADEHRRDD